MSVITNTSRHLLLIAALGASACAAPVRLFLNLQHPSPLSRYGQRIRLGTIENGEPSQFAQRLERSLRSSTAFEVVTANMQMGINGSVNADEFGPEQTGSRPYTCHRQVPEVRTRRVPVMVEDPPPADSGGSSGGSSNSESGASSAYGQSTLGSSSYRYTPPRRTHLEYRTEQYTEMVDQAYGCVQLLRWVDAHFAVRLTATVLPATVVWEREFNLADRQERTGLQGSDSEDHLPGPVSGPGFLEVLRQRAVDQAAAQILPRQEVRSVELGRIDDPRFQSAVTLAEAGDLAAAERQFNEICTRFATPRSDDDRTALARCTFDRGIMRGYSGRVDEAIADITQAIALAPQEVQWGAELTVFRTLHDEIEASRWRGENRAAASEPEVPEEPPRRAPTRTRRR